MLGQRRKQWVNIGTTLGRNIYIHYPNVNKNKSKYLTAMKVTLTARGSTLVVRF